MLWNSKQWLSAYTVNHWIFGVNMGVIALGKFEKLNEAGVIGGSAKQEFLGVHFFPNPTQQPSHKSPHQV